jgi:DNA-binding NtrC family response regulator
MPKTLQPKLLRALEEGEIRRVGSHKSVSVDSRVVAATNRDLERAVEQGDFREDLFWRLNVMPLRVPALRERPADIPLLAEHFLEQLVRSDDPPPSARRIASEGMALMTAYPWPGNVRELRNVVEGAATLAAGEAVEPADLPARVRESSGAATVVRGAADGQLPLRELEKRYILEIVKRTGGNRSRAAELLGLDRKTLYRKLQEYGIGDPAD